ncbi:MAG: class IV adenylate cyclase [Candidatus Nealsonbacteria bacterium]
MNVEVEIKVKINEFDKVKKILPKFCKFVKLIKQIDEYYVPCHRDYFAHKPCPNEWLRIRTNPNSVIFEYARSFNKKKEDEQDYADEYETEILQPDELRKILKFLDFRKSITVNKRREIWKCRDFEVCLDDVKGLGKFIEVEAIGNFKNVKEAKNGCIDFFKKINIENYRENQVNSGYPTLLLKRVGI